MPRKAKEACCSEIAGFSVDAVVSVDSRGQMVLPKEMRDAAGIKAGDKLALISRKRDGKVCCILLMKTDELSDQVKGVLGPMLETIKNEG